MLHLLAECWLFSKLTTIKRCTHHLLYLPLDVHSYKFKMHAGPCDASCRASSICGLQRTRTDSPYPCTDLPPGVTMDDVLTHLKKDIMC